MYVREIASKELTALKNEAKKRDLKLGWKAEAKLPFLRIPKEEEFDSTKIVQEIIDNPDRIKLYKEAKQYPTHICTVCSHAGCEMRTKCKQCGSKQVIPITTPRGEELFEPLKNKPYLAPPSFTDKLLGFVFICVVIGILSLIVSGDDEDSSSVSSSRSMTYAESVEKGYYIGLQNITGTQFEKDSFKCVGAMSVFDAYKTEGNYRKKEEWKRKSADYCKGVVY